MIRLDKYLADMGAGTRQEVKRKIRKGLVSVNHKTAGAPDLKIREGEDVVSVEGREIGYAAYEYYMLNKPAGVVSATTDSRDLTVVDLIQEKRRKDLFPVGRLDKDTEGLLLITNDGLLAHRLLSPRCHVDKTYYARIRGAVTQEDVLAFAEGVDIGEDGQVERTMPGILEVLTSNAESEIRLTIQEGKYHQVKRMFLAVGKEVTYLRRERMGTLVLDMDLKPGEYRLLTDEEKKGIGASGLA
ncbi:pseudouridine synthase [Lachnospiraceae bacterium 48-21]|jgi:16S rRNA pseudouridine516 synthase|nr:rRNA pseudouridine synthase [Dorea sp.]